MSDKNDATLIKEFLQGNEAAFEELVYGYEKKLYSLCYHYSGNQEDALDLVQEAFLRVYRFLPKFRSDASFSTWIYRLTVNVCLDFLRKKKPVLAFSIDQPLSLEDGDVSREIADDTDTPLAILEKKEARQEIRKAIESLPQEQRVPIVLKEFQGLSYAEIAAVLRIPVGTVRSRISRGRLKLKDIFLRDGTIAAGFPSKEAEGGA